MRQHLNIMEDKYRQERNTEGVWFIHKLRRMGCWFRNHEIREFKAYNQCIWCDEIFARSTPEVQADVNKYPGDTMV